MGELAEDRIYAERRGKTDVYVGAALGLTRVAISDDRVGRFRLVRRGAVRSVTTDGDAVLLATDEDVYRGEHGVDTFEPLGFGAAVAVGLGGDPVAAGTDGTVARYADGDWRRLGTVDDPRSFSGGWLAAADGCYELTDGTVQNRGLTDVADVAVGESGVLAATDDGLYRRREGEWTRERRGDVSVVTAAQHRAHAVAGEQFLEWEDGTWRERSLPVEERVVDVGYGGSLVAVTTAGTILVDPTAAKDGATGWRSRSLGLDRVTGLAVAGVPADRKRV